tara:strand:+ start:240 stop:506 length:267 start_codon:yes stop_codon:yes gene_type:complete
VHSTGERRMKVLELFNEIEKIAFEQSDVEEKDFEEMSRLLGTMSREDMIELVLEFLQITVRADVEFEILANPYQEEVKEKEPHLKLVH